jgi:tetratricopeptide (TPR) repeat protein
VTSSSSTNGFSDDPSPAVPLTTVGRPRRVRVRQSRAGKVLTQVGLGLCVAVVVAAPLLAGGVHRGTLIALMACGTAGISVFTLGSEFDRRGLRIGYTVLLPIVFLAIPVLQSVPLPLTARRAIDPKGTTLLTDDAIAAPTIWPVSLDPASTRGHIGKAALALAIFVIAFHFASGQSRRYLFTRVVALTGLAAVTIGIGHRILGIPKLYGLLISTSRTLLTGPFVNSNHTAELLELSAFACLACSLYRATALNRVGWMLGMLLCAGGVAATLSRGAVGGLAAGGLAFALLQYLAPKDPQGSRRTSLAWGGLVFGLVILAAAALGAKGLIERFQSEGVSSQARFQLWRESLRVIAAHPMGIGRGAFDRVFPIYRTMKMPFPIRFAFIENQPLQLLIDSGWVLFALIGVATAFVIWRLLRHGRHDKIEAALVAGLVAVLTHNLVDFGLETLGVLLPFMAILGTTLGRTHGTTDPILSKRWPTVVLACGGMVVGMISLAHASSDDFDTLLKSSPTEAARRDVLVRAQRAHPTDYYYALAYARFEPLKSPSGGRSPRLHALNRALALCPACEIAHVDVARNLWKLGLRSQSLLEWRTAVQIQPKLFTPALGELFSAGAKPEELASVASYDSARMIDVATFLGPASRAGAAMIVLDQAEAMGASRTDLLLTRANLQLQAGQSAAAQATISQAHAAGIRDNRLALLDAQLRIDTMGPAGADQALAILQAAAAQDPLDLKVQRMRLDLVTRFQKWTVVDRVLEDFKEALYRAQGSAAEAHLASARIYAQLSRWNNALGEYRIALADRGNDPALWMEYGRAADSAGRNATAREAYAQAARLSPNNPEITKALKAIDDQASRLRNQDSPSAFERRPQ